MNPDYLTAEELNFELKSRKIQPRVTLTTRRAQLKTALNAKKISRDDPFTWDENISELKISLAELNNAITENLTLELIEKLETKISHISERLKLIKTNDEESKKDCINNLTIQLALAEKTLCSHENNTFFSKNVSTKISFTGKTIPIYKWGLTKYSGSDDSRDILQFLELISEYQTSRGSTDEELYLNTNDLFTGEASVFCKNAKKKSQNWNELTSYLMHEYLPLDYQQQLETKLQNLSQLNFKNVSTYINEVEFLCQKLTRKITEQELISLIIKKMDPSFANILISSDFHSLDDFKLRCKKIQELKEHQLSNKETPRKTFQLNTRKLSNLQLREQPIVSTEVSRRNTGPSESLLKCWNCQQPGHTYPNCPQGKRIFCYGCGKSEVYKNKCPNCNPLRSGNEQSGLLPVEKLTTPSQADHPSVPTEIPRPFVRSMRGRDRGTRLPMTFNTSEQRKH